jgi:transposase-like protein
MTNDSRSEPAATASYDVAAVARRFGVASSTLRTWDRRYGIGPSSRTRGRHRRYSPLDLARLELMHALTLQGVPTGEAARVAVAAAVRAGERAWPDGDGAEPPARWSELVPGAGGGSANARASARARGMTRAVLALDDVATSRLVRETLRRRGVVWTWERLLVPVLVDIGERHEATGGCVEAEHLLSTAILAALSGVSARVRQPRNVRPVLLACAEEEQHSLPVYALAAALAGQRIASRNLGARTPRDALAAAVRRTGPVAVFVWSQRTQTAGPDGLASLPRLRPRARLIAGGPGWDDLELSPGVQRVTSLSGAVHAVAGAVGGTATTP